MGLFDVTQAALERALAGAALRQRVLANNVANANTAGFKRSDVDFHAALARALDTAPDAARVEALGFAPQTDSSIGRADGNNVDIDAEMASLAENAVEYQALVAVAKTRLRMLENVIGTTR